MANNSSKFEAKLNRGGQRTVHGGYSFLASSALPEGRLHVKRYLSAARQGLVEDLSNGEGEQVLTTQEVILIDRSVTLIGVLRCIEEHCRERGVFKGERLQPSLGNNYIAFTNALRQILSSLGIKRRAQERWVSPQEQAELIRAELREKKEKEASGR